jgi:hypothetical protein
MKPEGIVLREPNYYAIENSLQESKRRIATGRKWIAGLVALSASSLLAGLYLKKR